MGDEDRAAEFESHRRYLTGLAYRMLGSMSEAQDAVQDAYLRWHRVEAARVDDPRAYLSKIVTHLCLDQLKSARVRRETYVGPWLPEPILNDADLITEGESEYAHDLSVGLLLALERLSPLERAAFLLHDVFDMGFEEVADLLGRSEAACRQLAKRARTNVRAAHPRFTVPAQTGTAIVNAFLKAAGSGDVDGLAKMLTEDAVFHSDGGGKAKAALNVVTGRDRVARMVEGLSRKYLRDNAVEMRPSFINGMPGILTWFRDGSFQATCLEILDGRIAGVYVMRNPDKLGHLAEAVEPLH